MTNQLPSKSALLSAIVFPVYNQRYIKLLVIVFFVKNYYAIELRYRQIVHQLMFTYRSNTFTNMYWV